MSEILVKSDDKLTRLLDSVDKVSERLEELDGIKEENTALKEALASNQARLEKLEDSSTPGARRWESKYVPDSFERRRLIGEWACEVWKASTDPNYEARATGDVQVGGTDADGGFLVPTLVAPEVIRIVENAGISRSLCRVMPMGSDTVNLTSRDTANGGVKVLWEGEGVTITEDKEAFSSVPLTAKRLAGITAISEELDSDSAIDFGAYIIEVMGEAIAIEEDKQVFNSTTPFTGILDTANVASTVAGASFTNLDYSDVVKLQYSIDASLVDNGTFVFHPSIGEHLRNIKDTQGNPIWSVFAGNKEPTILGRPYRVTTQMPSVDASGAKFVLYGDFKHCVIGTRDGFRVAFSSEGGAGFQNMQRLIRVSERIAVAVPTPTAFGFLKTA